MPNIDSKRIAKNTLLLYGRMILVMGIGLYTSRVNLAALGVNDYGIYNVVGGFVAMFAILSGSLSAAISRFITFELGNEKGSKINEVFSTSVLVQFIIAGLIVLCAETIGLWFLNSKMNIDPERMTAANWVFQASVLTFVINLLSVPYNAAIIAHEKMSAFAYISLIEIVAKLAIAFIITIIDDYRLIVYSILILLTSASVRLIYSAYCRRHFPECKAKPRYHRQLFREMLAFSGWNFIGASSGVLRDQGVNVLLNIFFGTAVNAARGIATQVNNAIYGLCNNFIIALNPQITKSYAANQREECFRLASKGSKFAYFIMLITALPILFKMPSILSIWLTDVPDYTSVFSRLVIIYTMSEIISYPLVTIMLATGKIRNYQIVVGGVQMMNFPLSYIALKAGMEPQTTYVISIFLALSCLGLRLIMLRKMTALSIRRFSSAVLWPAFLVTLVCFVIQWPINHVTPENLWGIILMSIISVAISSASVLLLGCNPHERDVILLKVKSTVQRFIN